VTLSNKFVLLFSHTRVVWMKLFDSLFIWEKTVEVVYLVSYPFVFFTIKYV